MSVKISSLIVRNTRMPRSVRAKVKPKLLEWARVSAGYTLPDAAKKLKVTADKLALWESNSETLTLSKLKAMAVIYKRPLSVFYLPTPPKEFMAMRDFRRLPNTKLRTFSPELSFEIRSAHQRRRLALELVEELEEASPRFTLRASLNEDPEVIGTRLRRAIKASREDQATWQHDSAGYAAFNTWRQKIEAYGVLVFQATRLAPSEVSGFAIAETPLPVIVVTQVDTPPVRRTFSLLHEFVHLMLRLSGVSELDVDAARPPEDQEVEVFCNRVAAAALMPRSEFLDEEVIKANGPQASEWSDIVILELAHKYGVSREAIVRRLLTFGLTTPAYYQQKREQYAEEYKNSKELKQQQNKLSEKKFLKNPPRDALKFFGKPLVHLILESYHRDRMSLSDVSGYLGIRTRHVAKLEYMAGLRD